MKATINNIKVYNKYNPYLLLVLYIVFVMWKSAPHADFSSEIAVFATLEIIVYDLFNSRYNKLIWDNQIYPKGAILTVSIILLVDLLFNIIGLIDLLPGFLLLDEGGYSMFSGAMYIVRSFYNLVSTIVFLNLYFYVRYGDLKINSQVKQSLGNNTITKLVFNKEVIATGLFICLWLVNLSYYYAIEMILWTGNEFKLDALNIMTRGSNTIYGYNNLAIVILGLCLFYLIWLISYKLLLGKSIKLALTTSILIAFCNFNLSTLFVDTPSSVMHGLVILTILINTFIFCQIFTYAQKKLGINSAILNKYVPLMITLLSLLADWHYAIGGLVLYLCMNMKFNLIMKFREV